MITHFLKKTDLKLILILAGFYAVTLSISFIKAAYLKNSNLYYQETSWADLFFNYFVVDYFAVMFFVSFAANITKKMIVKKIKIKHIVLTHFFLSLTLGFFIYLISVLYFVVIGKFTVSQIDISLHIGEIIKTMDLHFLLYFIMVSIIYSYYFIIENKKNEIENNLIKSQLTNAKLNLLKSNLQPHFLFNTLNSISALVDISKTQAQNTIADLGNLLRELLDTGNENLITLEQELNILVKYINIIEVRFSDHFTFTSEIDDALLKAYFPSLLLQPIIENSIKHGYDYNTTDLEVNLSIEREDERILISISNNGKILEKNFKLTKTNIGIKNTLERLKTTYNNDFQYYMKNKKDESGIITHISIPYIR
jgi:two-component system LytT family sensor kinase